MDRKDMLLDQWQNEMVSTVAKANKNTIVVMRCSGATLMPWLDDVAAVLYVSNLPSKTCNTTIMERNVKSPTITWAVFLGHQNAMPHNDAAALHSSEAVEHYVISLTFIC